MIIKYSEPIYKHAEIVCSCHGETEIPEYVLEHPDTGGVRLKQTGTKPIYAIIQANKVNCDLQSVLEQCVHENQLASCTVDDVTSAIADFSGMHSLAEIYAGMKQLDNVWNETPLEVREQFNSSKAMFVSSIGNEDFADKLNDGFKAYQDSLCKRIDVKKAVAVAPAPSPAPDTGAVSVDVNTGGESK